MKETVSYDDGDDDGCVVSINLTKIAPQLESDNFVS